MIITRAMPTQQTAITGVSRRITAGQEIKAELCRGPGTAPACVARRQARWLTLRIEAPAQPDPVGGSGPEDGRTRGTAGPGDGCRADSYRPWSATTRAAPQARQPPLSACFMVSAPTHGGVQTPKPAPSGRARRQATGAP